MDSLTDRRLHEYMTAAADRKGPTDMTSAVLRYLTGTTAVLSVVTAGALFAFSSFVMPAFDKLFAGDAIRAMQAINDKAPHSLLMLPLIGGAIGSAIVGVDALVRGDGPSKGWLIVGAVLGTGALVITAAYHQPHNLALGRLDPNAHNAAQKWREYANGWTAWNTVRTLTGVGSGIALVVGLLKK